MKTDRILVVIVACVIIVGWVVYRKTDVATKTITEINLSKDSVIYVTTADNRHLKLIIQEQDSTIRVVLQDSRKTKLQLDDLSKDNQRLNIKVIQLEDALDSNRMFIHSLRRVRSDADH